MTTDPRRIEYLPLAELKADSRNPKAHDEQVIDDSINRFGVLDLIVRDERTGLIVSGHGRHKAFVAMEERGEEAPEGVEVAEDGTWRVPVVVGWASKSDVESGAALIALNRTTELGGWVDDALLELLDELDEDDGGFTGVGFSEADREALATLSSEVTMGGDDLDLSVHGSIPGDEDDEEGGDEDPDRKLPSGQSFKLLDVTVGDPESRVHWGEVYRLGGRHLLVIAKLAREHGKWSDLLEGRVFAPYPDIYLPLGERPKSEDFLLVQPSFYLAGHLLDKWKSVHGEASVELLEVR